MLTDEQKQRYKEIGIAGAILLFLGIFVWLMLSNAGKVSYNIQKLSDIRIMQSELEEYYFFNDQYPKDLAQVAEGLPLDFPLDSMAYAVCGQAGENCQDPLERKSYKLGYTLRAAADINEGRYIATPGNVMNRN